MQNGIAKRYAFSYQNLESVERLDDWIALLQPTGELGAEDGEEMRQDKRREQHHLVFEMHTRTRKETRSTLSKATRRDATQRLVYVRALAGAPGAVVLAYCRDPSR